MSFKSLVTVAVLGGVGVGLYMKINSMPDPKPPKDFANSWVEPPSIEVSGLQLTPGGIPGMPQAGGSTSTGGATTFTGTPGGTAPVFVPPAAPASAPNSSGPGADAVPVSANVELPPPAGLGPAAIGSTLPPAGANTSDPFNTHITGGPVAGNMPGPSPTGNQIPDYNSLNSNTAGGLSGDTALPTHTATGESLFYQTEHTSFKEAWAEARSMLQQRNLAAAHLLLSAWYNHPQLLPAEQAALLDLLSGLAGTVIYSPEHHLEPPYTVAAGDTLDQIARRYQVSPELLAKINGLSDPQRLTEGQTLKVMRGPFGAMVDATHHELVLVLVGRYAGKFPIGIGQDRRDIEGRYEVKGKATNPPYFGPDRTLEPGDPANPLGSHFLSLVKPLHNEIAGPFGIHGTSDAANVQRDDPRGYIRLAPHDIADCYDILSEKSQVLIRR